MFPQQASCELDQDDAEKAARLITRSPQNALLSVSEGRLHCTIVDASPISLCDLGTILLIGTVVQARTTCNRDPVFEVAVYAGSLSLSVHATGDSFTVNAGDALQLDQATGKVSVASAEFSDAEASLFQHQAAQFGVAAPGTSPATSASSATTESLTVSVTGSQLGAVTDDSEGIDCGTDCSADYAPGTTVTLTATPNDSNGFAGWGGDCAPFGTDRMCTLTMDASKSVTATFSVG
ncbi:MAG: InlB B-repeat-containing protein [Actinomycetota bacterium]